MVSTFSLVLVHQLHLIRDQCVSNKFDYSQGKRNPPLFSSQPGLTAASIAGSFCPILHCWKWRNMERWLSNTLSNCSERNGFWVQSRSAVLSDDRTWFAAINVIKFLSRSNAQDFNNPRCFDNPSALSAAGTISAAGVSHNSVCLYNPQ